jgi:hypothetical protein
MGLLRNRKKKIEYYDSPTILTFSPFATGAPELSPFVLFYSFAHSANRDPCRIPLLMKANHDPAF